MGDRVPVNWFAENPFLRPSTFPDPGKWERHRIGPAPNHHFLQEEYFPQYKQYHLTITIKPRRYSTLEVWVLKKRLRRKCPPLEMRDSAGDCINDHANEDRSKSLSSQRTLTLRIMIYFTLRSGMRVPGMDRVAARSPMLVLYNDKNNYPICGVNDSNPRAS